MPRIGGTANPSLRGVMMVDTVRGRIRVRAWPKPRGKNVHPNVRRQNDWFRDANALSKAGDPGQFVLATNLAKNTSLYPRDVLMRAMAAGFYDIVEDDGRVLTPTPKRFPTVSFQGAAVSMLGSQSIPAGVFAVLSWDNPLLNANGFWSPANPSRLTVPAGVNVVSLSLVVTFTTAANANRIIQIDTVGGAALGRQDTTKNGFAGLSITTPPIAVVQGDAFEARAFTSQLSNVGSGQLTSFGVTVLDNA